MSLSSEDYGAPKQRANLSICNDQSIVFGLEYGLGFPWKEYYTSKKEEVYSKNSNKVFTISVGFMF